MGLRLFESGSGHVRRRSGAIPLFQQELVQTYHWLTPQQFLDGVAIGQLTPGPITVVVTFAGYAVAGLVGAAVATVAMHLPPFVLMLGSTLRLPRLCHSSLVQGMLSGIMAGVLGMMGATAILLGRAAITNLWQMALLLVSVVLLIWWKMPAVYVILAVAWHGAGRTAQCPYPQDARLCQTRCHLRCPGWIASLRSPLPTGASGLAAAYRVGVQRYHQRSPAMVLGLTDHRWSFQELLTTRVPVTTS